MLELDHIAVAGETLEAATAHVEAALGLKMDAGGVHVEMGTHNRLLSLGPGLYMEAIAIDPDGSRPKRAPGGMGVPIPFQRGRFSWSMAVPGPGDCPMAARRLR